MCFWLKHDAYLWGHNALRPHGEPVDKQGPQITRQNGDQNAPPLAGIGDKRSGSYLRSPMPTRGGLKYGSEKLLFVRAAFCPH
jgi:hypothetical protein